ncbi:recombinase family protein [Heyndrickxia sporothermodurans]|uniref:recombinase family protein n=1 Tax=Heyndrickxia sporothermodurans TaxID=46224 RepID=UPI000D3CD6AB|nr:recombinase family protein [Heyndrickxia sporothermodurans]PTY80356.1 hypothetical protein B5V89_03460 [Heyndrickxia sporothermodurans]
MTVGIYIRVSTLEQAKEGYSIAAQKERLTAYCVAQDWSDYKFYVDEGASAKDTNRPELKKLFEDIKKGKIHMILVYRLDRFTRKVVDLHEMLAEMDKYNCTFKSATEPYDTTTAMGRMFITIVAALAQWETENLSERIKMALEEKVAGGERVGNIPYCFDLGEDEKLIQNEKVPVVLDMIEKLKQGMSANRISEYLDKTNNDRRWSPNGVLRILRNPALYGATQWNDAVYENTHEGIITKEEFMKIQQILEDRSLHHRREVKSIYLFQGVITCFQCGSTLSPNRYIRRRKDGTEYQGLTYRCQSCVVHKRKSISIGEYRFVDALKEYMKNVEIKNIEPIEIDDEEQKLTNQLIQIERKREKYQKGWAADLISDDEFTKLMNETRDIYNDLKEKLEKNKAPTLMDTEVLREIVFTFNQNFNLLTHEEKQKFISQFIRSIDFKLIPQPPKEPRKSLRGKDLVVITDVEFY